MAQRVARGAGALGRVLDGVGRIARPVLDTLSRRAGLPRSGRVRIQGLSAPVSAHVDAHGVPHIRAATDADAFFVEGYFHARDRFFQMDMLRRVLRGRLSEVVGERPLGAMALPPFGGESTTLDADRLMRALDLLPSAQRVWEQGGDEGRALLGAYVRGVNAGVRMLKRHKPLEHRLLRLPLRPWGPADSILIAKGMALGLSFKWRAAPVFAAVGDALRDEPERLQALLPSVPGAGAAAIARCVTEGIGRTLRFLPTDAPTVGSNAWLVGRGRTRSGKPMVASDPHLELSLPAIWYLASVRGREYGAVGATLPGLPGVVVGRTRDIAWGLTNGMLDDCDLWTEELDEAGERYRVDGAWRDLDIEVQHVPRRGASPAAFRLRRTHRGPLVSDAFPGYDG
ncbi:MAG: penicillin acylase family protein, partial [Planctomycetota bacterium]|nr:penicillin acylase family protein [Planctomycetota bacterium]